MKFKEILIKILNVIIAIFPFIPYLRDICTFLDTGAYFQCNKCDFKGMDIPKNYCPDCGRKIVNE